MKESIAVIGAGAAGLAAARALADRGFQVVVLEARDRIGGRIWTDRKWGVPVDLGVSFINGSNANPVAELAAHLGLRTAPYQSARSCVFDAKGRRLNDETVAAASAHVYRARALAAADAEKLVEDRSIADWIRGAEADLALAEPQASVVRWMLSSYTLFEGEELDALSLRHIAYGETFTGDPLVLPDGFDQLMRELARNLDIRTSSVVRRIEIGPTTVRVAMDGGSLDADRVLVTVPLGVLKARSIEFSPDLPKDKLAAVESLGVSALNKLALRFEQPFWPSDREFLGRDSPSPGDFPEFFNCAPHTGIPVLIGFYGARFGRELERESDTTIAERGMHALRSMFGSSVPDPVSFSSTRWSADPFSRCS